MDILDLFHVNGYSGQSEVKEFIDDPAVLFVSNRDGTFSERAAELGIADRGQGRGVVCFDYDRDGDIDVFIANNGGPPRLYRNEVGNRSAFLQIALRDRGPNTQAIGARIHVSVGRTTQMRELRAGSNYVSQDPALAHFGLGDARVIDVLRIVWPDGDEAAFEGTPANQFVTIVRDEPTLRVESGPRRAR